MADDGFAISRDETLAIRREGQRQDLALLALKGILGWDEACPFAWKCLRLALWIAAGGGTYILACFFLRVKELDTITKFLLRRS